jgi:hypothetical protein
MVRLPNPGILPAAGTCIGTGKPAYEMIMVILWKTRDAVNSK